MPEKHYSLMIHCLGGTQARREFGMSLEYRKPATRLKSVGLPRNFVARDGLVAGVGSRRKSMFSLWEPRPRKSLQIAVALVFVCAPVLAETAKTVEVGIPTTEFNFVSAAQLQREWCWAASVQMVMNWYNIPVRQSQIVKRIYGNTKDEAASENAITKALTGTAIDRKGRKLSLRAERRVGSPPANQLVGELAKRHPILITFHSSRKMLHAVVLTSAAYTTTAAGPRITSLTLRDPSPTFQDRHAAVSIRLTGEKLAKFMRCISSYYLVSISN